MSAKPVSQSGVEMGSDEWLRDRRKEAAKQIDLAQISAASAVAETKAKVAGMHGTAFSQKTGPLGILTKAKTKRETLLGGAVI